MDSIHGILSHSQANNSHHSKAGLAAVIIALLLTPQAHATGVCLICPPGHACSDNTASLEGAAGQVLIREGTSTAWKDVSTIALQGPVGATGPRGPQGATGPSGTLAGLALGGTVTREALIAALKPPKSVCFEPTNTTDEYVNVESQCSSSSSEIILTGNWAHCWCRMSTQIQPYCFSSWAYNGQVVSTSVCTSHCASKCQEQTTWRSSSTWP